MSHHLPKRCPSEFRTAAARLLSFKLPRCTYASQKAHEDRAQAGRQGRGRRMPALPTEPFPFSCRLSYSAIYF